MPVGSLEELDFVQNKLRTLSGTETVVLAVSTASLETYLRDTGQTFDHLDRLINITIQLMVEHETNPVLTNVGSDTDKVVASSKSLGVVASMKRERNVVS